MSSEQQLLEFLQQHEVCVLSTTMADGAPHSAVVSYSSLGAPLRLFFCTDSRSIKAQNLMSNRKAAVVVGWSKESWKTLQMRGEAHPIRNQAELAAAKEVHYAIHPGLKRYESGPDTIFYTFVPWWIRYSDFSHRSAGLGYFTVDGGLEP